MPVLDSMWECNNRIVIGLGSEVFESVVSTRGERLGLPYVLYMRIDEALSHLSVVFLTQR